MAWEYRSEPALYCDTLFSFLLNFNIENKKYLEFFINPKRRASDVRHYQDCVAKFTLPPKELSVFFAVYERQSFAFSKMFDHMSRGGEFSLQMLKSYLPDAETMCKKVTAFYFPDHKDGMTSAEMAERLPELAVLPEVKYHLLAMSIDPVPYYKMLFASIDERLQAMNRYYLSNKAMITAVKKAMDIEQIKDFLRIRHGVGDEMFADEMTYSIMLIGRNSVRLVDGDPPVALLGTEYVARMETVKEQSICPDIVKMGKALGEENRVRILDMLLVENELTAQQILTKLSLSMTATHYHLELLLQAGMLLTRNEGRTIYYSLHREYFDRAPLVFDKYKSPEM